MFTRLRSREVMEKNKSDKRNKRVVIIGASSGLGRRLAEFFIRDGWRVGVAARNINALKELKSIDPGQVEISVIDVTDPNADKRLLDLIHEVGGIDIYLHCVGILPEETTLENDVQCKVVDTNATGFVRMISTVFEYYRKSGVNGQIAAISSIAGYRGLEALPAYSASKAFDSIYLEALSQRAHNLKLKINITDIKPGWTRTPLLENGKKYLFEMDADKVAFLIYNSVIRKKKVAVIGRRWKVITSIERLVPAPIWRKIHIPLWK